MFGNQIRPIKSKMIMMSSSKPTAPVGLYPQFLLCDHESLSTASYQVHDE